MNFWFTLLVVHRFIANGGGFFVVKYLEFWQLFLTNFPVVVGHLTSRMLSVMLP